MIVADLEVYGTVGTMAFHDLQNPDPKVFDVGIGTRNAYWTLSGYDQSRSATTSIALEGFNGYGYLTVYAIDLGGSTLLSTSTALWTASPATITSGTDNNLIFGQFYRYSGGGFSTFSYSGSTLNQTYPDYCLGSSYSFYKGLFSDPAADHESTFYFAPFTNFYGMGVVYNFSAAPSTTGDIYLGNRNCCVGEPCDIGLDFTAGLDGATLHTELAQTCTGLGDGTNQYHLDYFNLLPNKITIESETSGTKQLCAWITGGTAEPFIQSFTANFYAASSTLGCFASDKMQEQDFCSDASLGCGDFEVSGSVWSELFCGLKQLGCWLVQPASSSLDYIGARYNTLKGKFPFSVYYDLTDSVQAGFASSSASRAGNFSLPMYSKTSSSFYMIKVLDASSTEKAIGKNNADTFRFTQTCIIWGIVAIIIILQLTL